MRIGFIIFLILCQFGLIGQIDTSSIRKDTTIQTDTIAMDSVDISGVIKKKTKAKITFSSILKNDTTKIYYFGLNDIYRKEVHNEISLQDIHYYNPAYNIESPVGDLGNIGSALVPLTYQPNKEIGLQLGQKQYDNYLFKSRDIRFYNSSKSFTNLFYSKGTGQNNSIFRGEFSKNYSRGLHFSIKYQKIIHDINRQTTVNQNAYYLPQISATSSLITGFWYESPSNNYNAFLVFNSNYVEQQNHGGVNWSSEIATKIETANQNSTLFSLPILLEDRTAKTRNTRKSILFKHHLALPLKFKDFGVVAAHEFEYENVQYKFYDDSPIDSIYNDFFVDSRGLRHFITDKVLSNDVQLKLVNHKKESGSKERLAVGLLHKWHNLNQEPNTNNLQNLFATAKLNLPISKYALLKSSGKLGVINSFGEFSLDGNLIFNLEKFGKVGFDGFIVRSQPVLTQSTFYISSQKFWENDFIKPVRTGLSGYYSLPNYHFKVSASTDLLTNYIFLNADQKYEQHLDVINITKLKVRKDFNFGILHTKSLLTLQTSNRDVIRIPSLIFNQSVNIQTRIFKKKMLASLGLDFQLAQSYKAKGYNLILGDFYLQDEYDIPAYPLLDAFLNVKVQNFKGFILFENISSAFTKEAYYQTPFYLKREMSFRFGISWNFWDAKKQPKKSNTSNPNSSKTTGPSKKGGL